MCCIAFSLHYSLFYRQHAAACMEYEAFNDPKEQPTRVSIPHIECLGSTVHSVSASMVLQPVSSTFGGVVSRAQGQIPSPTIAELIHSPIHSDSLALADKVAYHANPCQSFGGIIDASSFGLTLRCAVAGFSHHRLQVCLDEHRRQCQHRSQTVRLNKLILTSSPFLPCAAKFLCRRVERHPIGMKS